MRINNILTILLFFIACGICSCSKKNDGQNTTPVAYLGNLNIVRQGALQPTTPYYKSDSSYAETLTVQKVGDSIYFKFADHTNFYGEAHFLYDAGNNYQAYSGSHTHWSYSFPTADSVVYTYRTYSGIDAGHFSQTDIVFRGRKQ